jgi:phosphatidylinositol-3-phosphatase
VALLLALTGCSATPTAAPASGASAPVAPSSVASAAAGLPRPAHVLVVVFENKAAGSVVGNPDAPYLTSLARQGAVFSDAHGVTTPASRTTWRCSPARPRA